MKQTKILIGAVIGAGLMVLVTLLFLQHRNTMGAQEAGTLLSPYAGQEARGIKALSNEDIEGLLAGAGTPFGGMAKPGELNGFPGPRHVLDAAKTGAFELTPEQTTEIEALYEDMRTEAIDLGEKIIDIESELDAAFVNGTISATFLEEKVTNSANLYGQLRIVHLQTHLAMVDILTPQQVAQYNELRGYSSGDPCENVPDGHDSEMWRLHNNCG